MYSTLPSAPSVGRSIADRELIQSALAGDQQGYEMLVSRHQDRLYRSIRSDVGNGALAEDIVQEAFMKAFEKLDSFKGHSGFYTWLYRIALNLRRKHLRHHRRTTQLDTDRKEDNPLFIESSESAEQQAERQEERQQVQAALLRLDPKQRKILVLREFEGFDYATIAGLMHIQLGTVRSRLHRARSQLRKELRPYFGAQPCHG